MRSILPNLDKVIFITSFVILLTFGGFVGGFAVGFLKTWPLEPIQIIYRHAKTFLRTGYWVTSGAVAQAPAVASRQRVLIHEPDAVMSGYRGVMGWDKTSMTFSIWLLDHQGQVLHRWPINYAALDPDGPLNGSDFPHGMKILQDGSVLVNFDKGDVFARLDACGDPVWTANGVFHHSIEGAEDGSFWTWRGDNTAYGHYQYVVNFDPDTGATIREYGLVEDIISSSDDARAIFGLPADFRFKKFDADSKNNKDDIFHPNDVEALPSAIADKFPEFRAGDLLVSFRNIHLVAVLDAGDKRIKWWRRGPWRFQHDPDFTPDGRIRVYNNNTDRGRSDIIIIDPKTDQIEIKYSKGDVQYYAGWLGKSQRLPNDNILVVAATEGRVLEATTDGELVFEFNNVINESYNGVITNVVWLPMGFFTALPSCN